MARTTTLLANANTGVFGIFRSVLPSSSQHLLSYFQVAGSWSISKVALLGMRDLASTDSAYQAIISESRKYEIGMAFSCAMDVICTSMITLRLILVHWQQKKLAMTSSSSYLPIIVIFIESAALSSVAKVIQLVAAFYSTSPATVITTNLFMFPLCVSNKH